MKLSALFLAVLIGSATSSFAGLFPPEVGNYKYTLADITQHYQGLTYLSLDPARAIPDARYKLNRRGEFQIKNWFQQDWFEMQDMFAVDVPAYTTHYQAQTFNEAKRNAFSELKFSKRKFLHKKLIPTPREWGGLNHPPLKTLTLPLDAYSAAHAPLTTTASSYFDPALHREIDDISNSELTFGNTIQLLEDQHAFVAKKDLIRSAQETILMGSLVFVCDQGTRQIVELLIERKNAGVDVRVLVDATISKYLSHRECTTMLRKAGVDVIEGDDFWKYGRAIYHTKSLIVDFKAAISGGHNMIDADNLSRGTDFQNRDVDILTQGPLVTDIAMAFMKDWTHFQQKRARAGITDVNAYQEKMRTRQAEERTRGVRGSEHYARVLENAETRMNGVCRYVRQSPAEDRQVIGKVYLKMLDGVQDYLALTNPVTADSKVTRLNRALLPVIEWKDRFDMYNRLFDKLQAIAKRGTRIDYITTNIDMAGNENVAMLNEEISELTEEGRELKATLALLQIHLWNRYYGKPHYKNLLNDWQKYPNMHIWTHISFMHSKVFHFDRIAASIGSYNFQHNATDHAYEGTTICQDTSLNGQLDRVLVQDMANSIPLVFRP
jgi:phosphatidylserine/phosphatidylglycerophosphate/cardiolipin synthase-like enzyme